MTNKEFSLNQLKHAGQQAGAGIYNKRYSNNTWFSLLNQSLYQ